MNIIKHTLIRNQPWLGPIVAITLMALMAPIVLSRTASAAPNDPPFYVSFWNTGSDENYSNPSIPDRYRDIGSQKADIDYNFGQGPPHSNITNDHFVMRATKTSDYEAGTYKFTLGGDDGVRLFVDGDLVIDGWKDQSFTSYEATKSLSAGSHTLRLEFFENGQDAAVKLDVVKTSSAPVSNNKYNVSFWNTPSSENYSNPTIPNRASEAGAQVDNLDYYWNQGSPAGNITNDHFVMKAVKASQYEAGTYKFTLGGDDGVRLFIDDQLIINGWKNQSFKNYEATKTLTSGSHTLRVEYFENGGGSAVKLDVIKTGGNPTNPPTPPPVSSSNPLYGKKLAVKTDDVANQQVRDWQNSRPGDADQIRKIANTPRALWVGGWNNDIRGDVDAAISKADGQGAIQTLVAYNIPNRDCGSYSGGGAGSKAGYDQWIDNFSAGIKGRDVIVILEPDALAQVDVCLSGQQQNERYQMFSNAVTKLTQNGALVYIDASIWINADEMASRLNRANIAGAQGVAINTSNFQTTTNSTNYANQLSPKIGGKHFIIDTSRNGRGAKGGEWCNPSGRGLGQKPSAPKDGVIDAYLWVKGPGESDGTCNGGPAAGSWWGDYALTLARNSNF